jgi:hypothetical protein
MNSNIVLNKIMKLLSLNKEEVSLTYARLKDGTIVESATFDVGEAVDIVSEDGTKTPAPDGEHELALKDSEGNETLLKITTKGGKIEERANVELEILDVKPIPQADQKDKVNEVPTAEGSVTSGGTKLAEVEPTTSTDETTEEVEPLPSDTDSEDMGTMVQKLQYRIDELEKRLDKMAKNKMEEKEKESLEEDEELPKLDGAPIEESMKNTKFSAATKRNDKIKNTQNRFLENLYK